MITPSRRTRLLLVTGAGLAAFEVALLALRLPRPSDLVAFACFAALTELFEIEGPHNIRSSLGAAPALAYVALGNSPLEGALAYACGALITRLARLILRRPVSFADGGVGALIVLGAGALYHVVAAADPLPTIGPALSVSGIGAALATSILIDTLFKATRAARSAGAHVTTVLRSSILHLAVLHVAIMSMAGLLALAYPTQGLLSMPLLLGPIIVTHYAFARLEFARRLYVQTVEALSQVPEIAGYAVAGHAQRVADLAMAVAREMSADAADVEQTQYAALLHEIGRLALPEPEEGDEAGVSKAEVAEAGAAVAAETRHFPRVAEMIRHQHVPYRRRGLERRRDVPLGARIIKVVCAYDTFRSDDRLARSAWEAMEHLYLGLTYEYDPSVVQALVQVLERRGEPETGLVYDSTKQRNAERMKQDFVSTVSHELRTPLTPIRGYASLLLNRGHEIPEETKREALESILAGTDRLQRLIEDLLLASSIAMEGERAMSQGIEPEPANVEDLARQALRPFQVEHADRPFIFASCEPVIALTDRRLLGQVLGNLLSNAVKFSHDGTPIDVIVERAGHRAAIRVVDRGCGIPADMLEAIFGKFTRLEDPMRMETNGAGLGLFIVRQLAAAMNGSVTVESTVGEGSTFTVWLPMAGAEGRLDAEAS